MKTLTILTNLVLSGLPAFAAESADHVLRSMSAKLAAAKHLSFKTREIDPALTEGRSLSGKAKIDVNASRPNRIKGPSVSRERTMYFIAGGLKLTIYNQTKNHHAQVPMRTSMDALADRLDAEYGFVPPLADFVVSNPYKEIREQARSTGYAGRESLSQCPFGFGGVECDRVDLRGRAAEATLWIGANDHLPHRMVTTFARAGHPQVRIAFASWNLNAPAADYTFRAPRWSSEDRDVDDSADECRSQTLAAAQS